MFAVMRKELICLNALRRKPAGPTRISRRSLPCKALETPSAQRVILITILLSLPAMSVELFRYRGAAMDGGTLEYIFETDEQDVPKTVSKERAADFVTTFYRAQIAALETQEFRTQPVPFWLVSFSDTTKGPMRQMFFVVLLPDGTVVEPRVEKRL